MIEFNICMTWLAPIMVSQVWVKLIYHLPVIREMPLRIDKALSDFAPANFQSVELAEFFTQKNV